MRFSLQAVERLVHSAESGCCSKAEQVATLNCVRLMTRILPYIFEDPDWRGFFWSSLPAAASDSKKRDSSDEQAEEEAPPLAQSLLNALSVCYFPPSQINIFRPHKSVFSALTKQYFPPSQISIFRPHKSVFSALTKKYFPPHSQIF